jgi:hypothetical protein
VLYPGMVFEPLSDHDALVSLQIVGDHVDDSLRDGPLYLLKQLYVALGVPRAGREGQRLAVIYSEGAENPRLVRAAAVLQRRLDAVPVRRLSRGRGEEPRGYGAELVDADHRGARWRVRVESDDLGPFGANSGSGLSAHGRVLRQRTPSQSRMRLTWLRPTSMPISCAASARVSKVQ